jgi:tetratricopeptide (TPR) repeat protein
MDPTTNNVQIKSQIIVKYLLTGTIILFFFVLAYTAVTSYRSKQGLVTKSPSVIEGVWSVELTKANAAFEKNLTVETKALYLTELSKHVETIKNDDTKVSDVLEYAHVLGAFLGPAVKEKDRSQNIQLAVQQYRDLYMRYENPSNSLQVSNKSRTMYSALDSFIGANFNPEYVKVFLPTFEAKGTLASTTFQAIKAIRPFVDDRNVGVKMATTVTLADRLYLDAVYLDSFSVLLSLEEKNEVLGRMSDDFKSYDKAGEHHPNNLVTNKFFPMMHYAYANEVYNRYSGAMTLEKNKSIDETYEQAIEYIEKNKDYNLDAANYLHAVTVSLYVGSIYSRGKHTGNVEKINQLVGLIKSDANSNDLTRDRFKLFVDVAAQNRFYAFKQRLHDLGKANKAMGDLLGDLTK